MKLSIDINEFEIDKLPNYCPVCRHTITPRGCFSYPYEDSFNSILQVTFLCPNDQCKSLFIAIYSKQLRIRHNPFFSLKSFEFLRYAEKKEFHEAINKISPSFEEIFNEALIAENNNLFKVAGGGYRKALEFLIKDYLINFKKENKDLIGKQQLGEVIKKIKDPNLETCASRAAWLGNDEIHYLKKWADRDLEDLKTLIDITVNCITNEYLVVEYESVMPSPALKGTN